MLDMEVECESAGAGACAGCENDEAAEAFEAVSQVPCVCVGEGVCSYCKVNQGWVRHG
jgi:hypothetical protein